MALAVPADRKTLLSKNLVGAQYRRDMVWRRHHGLSPYGLLVSKHPSVTVPQARDSHSGPMA